MCNTATIDSESVYHIKVFIDSNPTLFFVNIHSIFESYIDKNFRIRLFRAVEKIKNVKYDTEYRFNYWDRLIDVHVTDVKDTLEVIDKQLPHDKKVLDGISLVFLPGQMFI